MGRTKLGIQDRADLYKDDKFYVSDNTILMCGVCNCRLEWEKKDNLDKHVATAGHIRKKEAAKKIAPKRQATIVGLVENAKKAKLEKVEFIQDTVTMCLKANIPLHKLNHPSVREYLKNYVPGSGDLPLTSTLRSQYLEPCADTMRTNIMEAVTDKPLVVVADGTSDCKGRCVLGIIFRTLTATATQDIYLGTCAFLDKADASTCSQAIVDSLSKYKIKWENVVGIVSDSAPYMSACFRALNVFAGDTMLHCQCWAHKVNLAGDIFMKELTDLNWCISKVKMAYLNSRKMKSAYLNYLRTHHPELSAKLFPSPVITRWNSWFQAVAYFDKYIEAMVAFMKQYEAKNSSTKLIVDAFEDKKLACTLGVQSKFVAEVCDQFVKLINVLEGSKYPYAHMLWNDLLSISAALKRYSEGYFPTKTTESLNEIQNAVQRGSEKRRLQVCCQKSMAKLASHMATNPTNNLYQSAHKLFNPAIAGQNIPQDDHNLLLSKNNLPSFKDVDGDSFLTGYRYFHDQLVTQVREGIQVDVIQLLMAVQIVQVHKKFAEAALQTIWAPVNSVDAERYFSQYNLTLTDRRTRMKETTIETCTMLRFNDL